MNKIDQIIEQIKNGKIVIIVDDDSRENEGDLCIAVKMFQVEGCTFRNMGNYGAQLTGESSGFLSCDMRGLQSGVYREN